MCTGSVTSDERVVNAKSNGSSMRRRTASGRSPIPANAEDRDLYREPHIHEANELREAKHGREATAR